MSIHLKAFSLLLGLLVSMVASAGPFAPETALSDAEMEEVNAQHGVILDLLLLNNVTDTFLPKCVVAVGTPNICRLVLEFENRPGAYLMFKEYYGTLQLKEIRMDAAVFGSNTVYVNNNRFTDITGTICLIPGKALASCNPANTPAIQFTYPGTDAQATYDDMHSLLNIGRVWIEYDVGAPCSGASSTSTNCGYNRDTTLNSAYSLRLADASGTTLVPDPDNPPDFKLSNNTPAKMRYWGTAYVFGF